MALQGRCFKSERTEDSIPEIVSLSIKCDELGIQACLCRLSYWCITRIWIYLSTVWEGTTEAEVVDEVKRLEAELIKRTQPTVFMKKSLKVAKWKSADNKFHRYWCLYGYMCPAVCNNIKDLV